MTTTFSVTIPDYTIRSLEQDRAASRKPQAASSSTAQKRYGKAAEPLKTKERADEFFGTINPSSSSLARFSEYDYVLLKDE